MEKIFIMTKKAFQPVHRFCLETGTPTHSAYFTEKDF